MVFKAFRVVSGNIWRFPGISGAFRVSRRFKKFHGVSGSFGDAQGGCKGVSRHFSGFWG